MGTQSVFSDDIAAVYAKTKEIIKQHKLLQICRVEKTPQKVSVIINNLWRIDRSLKERFKVSLHMFSLTTGRWLPNTSKNIHWADFVDDYYRKYREGNATICHWPDLLLLAFGQESFSKCSVSTANAIKCALIAAGFQALPQWDVYMDSFHFQAQRMPTQERPPIHMAQSILSQYTNYIIRKSSRQIGMRYLRKVLWEHIVDRELASALISMNPHSLSLERYLSYLPYAKNVIKIAQENRNLLPLLPSIPKKYWGDPNLFSKTFWVENPQRVVCKSIPRFASVAALRWIRKAPISVVAAWINNTSSKHFRPMHPIGSVVDNLSRANITFKIPAIVLSSIVQITSHNCTKNVCPQMQRLYKLYAIYCFKEWKKRGWKNFKYFMTDNYELRDTFDWLDAEGFRQGYPDKNATWESVQRRVSAWHLINPHEVEEDDEEKEPIPDWNSLLGAMEISGVKIFPLTSQEQLKAESRDMHHCVRQYAAMCHANQCRIFSLVEPTGERSTLSIEPSGNSWCVQQHRGVCNENVSEFIKNIGIKVAILYRKEELQ